MLHCSPVCRISLLTTHRCLCYPPGNVLCFLAVSFANVVFPGDTISLRMLLLIRISTGTAMLARLWTCTRVSACVPLAAVLLKGSRPMRPDLRYRQLFLQTLPNGPLSFLPFILWFLGSLIEFTLCLSAVFGVVVTPGTDSASKCTV